MTKRVISDWRALLGRKVSVRYRLREAEHPFSEAIGVVAAVGSDASGAQMVSILTRSGQTKQIAVADITASKLFPL